MLAKQLEYLGGAQLAGIVLGARVPTILTSRADSAETRLTSCAVAVLLHYATMPAVKVFDFSGCRSELAPVRVVSWVLQTVAGSRPRPA